jgi:hypothetical protein
MDVEPPKIKDFWTSTVLALATTGGIILDVSKRKYQIIISTINSHDVSRKGELDFQSFIVTKAELNQLLAEVLEVQSQVDSMISQVEKEKKEKDKEDEKKTRNKKTLEKKKTKRVFPPPPHNLPEDACSVEEPMQCEGDVVDYDNDIDKIGDV